MLCASLVTSARKCASAVFRIACRTRGSAETTDDLRLTITTSAQVASAINARTTAAPTCPVPPMIKTRNPMSRNPMSSLWGSDPAAQRALRRLGERVLAEADQREMAERRHRAALDQAHGG